MVLPVEIHTESKSHTELDVTARKHTFTIDEPESFGGTDKGANPLEFLFAGLAGCLNVTIHLIAKERDLEIETLKIDVKGTLDLEGFQNKESDKKSGFSEITVEVDMKTNADEAIEQEMLKEAEKRCPVSDTIQQGCSLKIEKKQLA